MKTNRISFTRRTGLWLALAGLFFSVATHAAPAPAHIKTAPASTNAAPVEIPKSEFAIPLLPREGRDPFFPSSSRVYSSQVTKTNTPVLSSTATFKLGVLSPKFATIINGNSSRTLAVGEEAEFNTPGGPLRVKCIEIREDSVIIEVNSQRRELSLSQGMR